MKMMRSRLNRAMPALCAAVLARAAAQSAAQLADLLPKEIAHYKKAMQVAGIQPQ